MLNPARMVATKTAAAPYTPTERITNGGFADGSNWTPTNWTIAAGIAVVDASGGILVQELGVTVPGGHPIDLAIDTTDIDTFRLVVQTTLAGSVVETLYTGFISAEPSISAHVDVGAGDFDGIKITAPGAGSIGSSIDNVSLIA